MMPSLITEANNLQAQKIEQLATVRLKNLLEIEISNVGQVAIQRESFDASLRRYVLHCCLQLPGIA